MLLPPGAIQYSCPLTKVSLMCLLNQNLDPPSTRSASSPSDTTTTKRYTTMVPVLVSCPGKTFSFVPIMYILPHLRKFCAIQINRTLKPDYSLSLFSHAYYRRIPTILFWLLVFITIMFAQNIILAIVGNAYTDCAEKVGEDDMPFVRFTIRRIIYEVLCKWPHLKDGAVSFGHKSTRVMEKKVDIIKVTQEDTQEESVQKTAEMISRRDNQMLYRKGKIVQVSDSYCFGRRYLVQYTEGATNTVYE